MFQKKITMMLAVLLIIFFSLTIVSAAPDNMTEDGTEDIVSSVIDEEFSNDTVNSNGGEIKSENNDDYLTSNGGEFIDVNDAYVYMNEFRTQNGVWQWNEDDTTKTYFNTDDANKLQPLARDINLENTAKIRAKEIAESFSHMRPDGTSCFTAFPDGLYAMGENIAYGQINCKDVTEAWKETNDPYDGQGHRRNMLDSSFNCVGIAGYKLNGVIYWVQDFGNSNNIVSGEIKYSDAKVTKKATKITAKSKIFKVKTKIKKYTITLKAGKNAVKKVKVYLKIKGKTYGATTKNTGKATFKIKLNKKGSYKATIMFKGNKNYKSATKKITIKIK